MNVQLHFKNIPKTPDLEEYTIKKVTSPANKFEFDKFSADVEIERVGNKFFSKCRLNYKRNIVLTATDFDVYMCIDSIHDKMLAVFRKDKERRIKENKRLKKNRSVFDEDFDDSYFEFSEPEIFNGTTEDTFLSNSRYMN